MDGKTILLIILSFIAGSALIGAGIYFLTHKFASNIRANVFGYVSLGLGALTLVWAFMLLSFPQLEAVLALVYMFFLLIAVTILMIMMK